MRIMPKHLILAMFLALVTIGCNLGDDNSDVDGLPKNNRAVIIGDSIFALSGDIKEFLAYHAEENYRGYAHNGARVTSGTLSIPVQYEIARADDSNITTVIMNGGGNDVLFRASACAPFSQTCQNILDDTFAELASLLERMHADGVQNVVYLGYYRVKGSAAALNPALDIGLTGVQELCLNAPVDCHFVEVRDDFAGHPEWILNDGIHPTRAGSEVLADEIWDTMLFNDIDP